MAEAYRPLEGIKVVELSTMVAASSCGRMLADWGCEIVKIETDKGDMFRNFPKTFFVPCTDDENPLFDNLNAGKRGIVLDLKTPEGMEAIHRMLAGADVFLTNTRPNALKRLGLDYDSLKERYPKLIHASLNGFGEKGPKANNPGFDTVAFWASSGFNVDMSLEGPNSYPVYGSAGPGDIITAMGLCYAIAAALFKRTQTGQGDRVYSSLYGTALWCFHIMTVSTEERYGNKFPKRRDNSAPTASAFRTQDGEWVTTTLLKIEEQWPKLCHVLGVDQWAHDPRFCTSEAQRDPEVRKYLMEEFAKIYATKTAAEWCRLLTEADIVNDRMAHFSDMEKSEQAWANDFIHEVTCPNGSKSVLVRPSMRSERMGLPEWKRGPMLGEHTREVLAELGFSQEEIEEMRAKRIARQHD